MRKSRKSSNPHCTSEVVENDKELEKNIDTENQKSTIEKELDTIQKLVNSLKKSSRNEKNKSTDKLKNENKAINISENIPTNVINKENHNLGQDQNCKNSSKNIVAKFKLPKLNGSSKCKNQTNICPSKKETGISEDHKTHSLSSSSHALNNIKSTDITDNISPVLKAETTVYTQNNIFVDSDAPFRLMRSQSTSTCSALYSPLLKGRQNNDLRFHQQKGRYSDTICSR